MTDISDRLQVEGPDRDGDYELTLRDCDCDSGQHSHYISPYQATMLAAALSPLPASSEEAAISDDDMDNILDAFAQDRAPLPASSAGADERVSAGDQVVTDPFAGLRARLENEANRLSDMCPLSDDDPRVVLLREAAAALEPKETR